MSIFRSAYETKACEGFAVEKLLGEIKKTMATGWLNPLPDTSILRIDGSDTFSTNIPSFMHPIVIENHFDGMPSPSLQLAIDARPYGKWDQHQRQFAVRNGIEYDLLVFRAKLNAIWISHPAQILRDVSPLPMSVFCSWISENVARRFALDPAEQMKLAILSGLLYQSNFTDMKDLIERDTLRMTQAISKATRTNAQDVLDVLDKFTAPISGIKELCERAQEVTGSVRLNDLNVGVLIGILGKTWYSASSAELLFVALEHPPTWLAIMMAAAQERTFKNSQITKIAERQSSAANKQFSTALVNLVNVTSGK